LSSLNVTYPDNPGSTLKWTAAIWPVLLSLLEASVSRGLPRMPRAPATDFDGPYAWPYSRSASPGKFETSRILPANHPDPAGQVAVRAAPWDTRYTLDGAGWRRFASSRLTTTSLSSNHT